MSWMVIVAIAWVVAASAVAMLIGRSVHVADETEPPHDEDFVPADWLSSPAR